MTVRTYYKRYWPEVMEIADDPERLVEDDNRRLLAMMGRVIRNPTREPTFPFALLERTIGTGSIL